MAIKLKRSVPMPVKYWAFAGISITNWCSASCPVCYMCCGPDKKHWMEVDRALDIWSQLSGYNPQGCRIHITGGEPFGDWDRLIEICVKAKERGLNSLEKVETNGFWATDFDIIRNRLLALDAAGMEKFAVSADPFHQMYVPIEQVRYLVDVASRVLGAHRVQVRWRDWLDTGFDLSDLEKVRPMLEDWIVTKRDRINGRAAEQLAEYLPKKPVDEFEGTNCMRGILRGKHVHISSDGEIIPGVCAGLSLGNVNRNSVEEIWEDLFYNWKDRPVVSTLAEQGSFGLFKHACEHGFAPDPKGYVSSCHLCWCVRKFLVDKDMYSQELAPGWIYETGREF